MCQLCSSFFTHNQLTISPALPDHTIPKDNMEQSQSMLLTKLPPELRVMIWDNALDTKTLHFEWVDSRLQCVWCYETKAVAKLGFRHKCWNAHRFISREGRRPIIRESPTAQGQGRGRSCFLLTCKIMYVQNRITRL